MKNFNAISLLGASESTPQADWIVNSFPIVRLVVVCLIALLSIGMIIAVLMQDGSSNGVSSITGDSNTFYNRNKGMSLQGKIKRFTVIISVCIVVLCIAYLILYSIYSG